MKVILPQDQKNLPMQEWLVVSESGAFLSNYSLLNWDGVLLLKNDNISIYTCIHMNICFENSVVPLEEPLKGSM